jgi:hypothetical protein
LNTYTKWFIKTEIQTIQSKNIEKFNFFSKQTVKLCSCSALTIYLSLQTIHKIESYNQFKCKSMQDNSQLKTFSICTKDLLLKTIGRDRDRVLSSLSVENDDDDAQLNKLFSFTSAFVYISHQSGKFCRKTADIRSSSSRSFYGCGRGTTLKIGQTN